MSISDSMLVVERGISGIRVIPLEHEICVLGAAPNSDIFIDSPYVSRMHAQITREGESYRIRDLESKNGTFVNGNRLKADELRLKNGDRIELAEGQIALKFLNRGTTVSISTGSEDDGVELVLDQGSREVWLAGAKLDPPLSRKEFDVLGLLYKLRGQACSKDDIAEAGWPERDSGDVGDQEIEQSVRRLRLRIEPDASNPHFIITVRGFGYKLSQG